VVIERQHQQPVSASAAGDDIALANSWLGWPYRWRGSRCPATGGRTIGFPTANIAKGTSNCLPTSSRRVRAAQNIHIANTGLPDRWQNGDGQVYSGFDREITASS
jgi:FAD synthase